MINREEKIVAETKTEIRRTRRAGQRGKSIEEVITYALSHRTRVLVLSLLNEGTYTVAQISEILDIPVEPLAHHIRELADAGSIELARTEEKRNFNQHYYRAVEMPFYSDEEVWAMTPIQRQVSAGLILQNVSAEMLTSFWAGKMRDDPHCWLAWRWFNVDGQGRQDIADEQQRFWDRMQEIEAESTARRLVSGEEATSVIVAELAFEREREAPMAGTDA